MKPFPSSDDQHESFQGTLPVNQFVMQPSKELCR
jgi:hypothetical protein